MPQPADQAAGGSKRTPAAWWPGADMRTDDQVDIINPADVIATLTDDVPFVMELVRGVRGALLVRLRSTVPRFKRSASSRSMRHQPRGSRPLRSGRDPRGPKDRTTTS